MHPRLRKLLYRENGIDQLGKQLILGSDYRDGPVSRKSSGFEVLKLSASATVAPMVLAQDPITISGEYLQP